MVDSGREGWGHRKTVGWRTGCGGRQVPGRPSQEQTNQKGGPKRLFRHIEINVKRIGCKLVPLVIWKGRAVPYTVDV